jgi:ABC-type uncharacterized transport system involved in gliding motility auxiliary subunit
MVKRLFSILGWLGTALVLAAVAVRFLRPDLQQVWNGLALSGLACVLLYLVSQWREVFDVFGARTARYGALSAASVLLLLAILVAVNYIAARQNRRWDLTAAGQFSLSDQTRKVLASLQAPVRVLVFDRNEGFQRFRDRLDGYSYASPNVQVEYIDVDQNPTRAREAEVQQYGTLVVEYQNRRERVTTDAEQDITNAIVKAVEGQQKKVYFVQGHGEKDPDSIDEQYGYNTIKTALGRDNFLVEKVVLAQQGAVPQDASVLVIAGPTNDYLAPEVEALRQYLNRGGKVLCLLDPPEGRAQPTPNLTALVSEWGIEVGANIVVDVSGVGQLLGAGPSMPVAASYPSHPITQNFNVITAYPVARSVTAAAGGASGRIAQSFIETSGQSWAETDLKALAGGGRVALDEAAGDKPGPISVGAAVSADAPEAPQKPDAPAEDTDGTPARPQTRVAVIGDSDFAANGFLGVSGNQDMFLNTVNWLAQQENLIAIRPRDAEDRRVTLTAERQRFTFYISVLGLPFLVLGAGILTWWRRR